MLTQFVVIKFGVVVRVRFHGFATFLDFINPSNSLS